MTIIRDGFQSADLDVPVVLPTLNLDFANSQSLDERITFSRGSIGTFVNKNGLIETAPANTPRFDYDPITGECRGLLIEESRQNLISNSNGFGGDTTDYGITSGITSPDGTSNAVLMYEKTNNGFHFLTITPTFVVSTTYCASIFCKYAGSKYRFRLKFSDVGGQNNIIIDLRNGSIISGSGVSNNYGVIKYPNGWYRVYTTLTATSTSGFFQPFLTRDSDGTSSYQGDGSSGFYIYGAQVEVGTFPTSYIPTSGSTVTRSADNASIINTSFSGIFGSGSPSELSVFYSGLAPYASINGAYYWQLTNNAITERILFRYAGLPQIIPYVNGLAVAGGVFANASQVLDIKSIGLIDDKSFAIRLNDGNPDYQFTNSLKLPRIPTGFQQLNIGSSHSGFNYLNGTMRKLAIYQKRLSSSQAVYLVQ